MKSQNGFVWLPILLVILGVLIVGGGAYYVTHQNTTSQTPLYQSNEIVSPEATSSQQKATNNNPTSPTQTATTSPSISSVTPSTVAIGGMITIHALNLDPLGGYAGNGWISNDHTFLYIENSSGQTQLLWEGNSGGGYAENIATDTIETLIPPGQPCIISSGTGGCARGAYEIAPGQYSLSVTVDGRGTSNSVPLTVVATPAPIPTISSVSSSDSSNQFYPGDQVTITGSNFPVTDGQSLMVWVDATTETNNSALAGASLTEPDDITSATSQQIKFTVPELSSGSYDLYVLGTSGGYQVQSNAVSVTILPKVAINSISPTPTSVGDAVQISGRGFTWSSSANSSGLVHVYIQTPTISGPESSGLLWVGSPTSDSSINFTLPTSFCTLGGDPGVPCTRQTALVSGNYLVSITSLSGIDSNQFNFTVR